jgi:hypothetical protein
MRLRSGQAAILRSDDEEITVLRTNSDALCKTQYCVVEKSMVLCDDLSTIGLFLTRQDSGSSIGYEHVKNTDDWKKLRERAHNGRSVQGEGILVVKTKLVELLSLGEESKLYMPLMQT